MRTWWSSPLLWTMFIVAMFACLGCTARPMVCTWVHIGDDPAPALACADANAVKGEEIRPWVTTPSPGSPAPNSWPTPRPYWPYEGYDYKWREHADTSR